MLAQPSLLFLPSLDSKIINRPRAQCDQIEFSSHFPSHIHAQPVAFLSSQVATPFHLVASVFHRYSSISLLLMNDQTLPGIHAILHIHSHQRLQSMPSTMPACLKSKNVLFIACSCVLARRNESQNWKAKKITTKNKERRKNE